MKREKQEKSEELSVFSHWQTPLKALAFGMKVGLLSFCGFASVWPCDVSSQLNILWHHGDIRGFTWHNSYNPWVSKAGTYFGLKFCWPDEASCFAPRLRVMSLSGAVGGGIQGIFEGGSEPGCWAFITIRYVKWDVCFGACVWFTVLCSLCRIGHSSR